MSGAPTDVEPPDGMPPIDDPFLVRPAPPPEADRATTSKLAITAIVALLFGPVGAICAIVFGLAARREIEAAGSRRSGYVLATLGVALGTVLSMAWAAWLSIFVWSRRLADPVPVASAPDEPAVTSHTPDPAPTASAPSQSAQRSEPSSGGLVPKQTRMRREGKITVVDVGVSATSLAEELAKQRAEAAANHETLVVMTTRDPCDPCRGFDRSLNDAQMQTALSNVRLVRVDIDVFKDDLDSQKMPVERYPSFFLLSVDLTPKDGIDGGEWDDDIPQNIAPVLGAFVRGKYATRRQTWQPPPGSGVRL